MWDASWSASTPAPTACSTGRRRRSAASCRCASSCAYKESAVQRDRFAVARPPLGCPSTWQLSHLAMERPLDDDAALRAHVLTCARCALALASERAETHAAASEVVPAALLQGRPPRRRIAWRP